MAVMFLGLNTAHTCNSFHREPSALITSLGMASTRTADARSIAQRNSAGSAVAALMNPALTKRALTRDHVKENLLQLRDKQRANAEAREQVCCGARCGMALEIQ